MSDTYSGHLLSPKTKCASYAVGDAGWELTFTELSIGQEETRCVVKCRIHNGCITLFEENILVYEGTSELIYRSPDGCFAELVMKDGDVCLILTKQSNECS